jgi:hypothetical protein
MKILPAIVAFFCGFSITYSVVAKTARISEADCAQLTEHVPDASVAYQPGVDVNGDQVVSADLGGSMRIEPPKEITIPIYVDVATLTGTPSNRFQTDNTQVGTVTYKNGKVYYNGKPLQNDQQARIAEACKKRR